MAIYLLDTMVVSEAIKPVRSAAVEAWLDAKLETELRISVLTFAEIYAGIDNMASKNAARSRRLAEWAKDSEQRWHSAIVDVDLAIARTAGPLIRRLPSEPIDALIGATALVHGWIVATRNVRHFRLFDVPVVDPYA
jgi:toxin FitB